ncbi:PQQ-dependent sugar dehydrogenase [Opitutales bacterium]|jgi:glucose/arabinose dehydrogenase|nr:PQQ-dependent sugar dehydrogenase [Opitutales bacterium]
MKKSLFLLLPILSCLCFGKPAVEYQLSRVYNKIKTPKPINIVVMPDGSGKELLVLQGGKVLTLPKDRSSGKSDVFLDLSGANMIEKAFEEGLLGLVFHPDFKKNKKFYLYHTLQNPKRSRLVERRMSKKDPSKPDDKYERLLLELPQPFWNHNSGNPVFGPDNFLYISTGDGGKANDPLDHSQNTFALYGKILRIDVDARTGDLPYGIPGDNPFVGKEGHRSEIWALGLRNPWGIHWDHASNTLFCADVGQNQREEINVIKRGGNYGWSFREGTIKFAPKHREPPANSAFVDPIFEYDRTLGLSVSGGIVYRGKNLPTLRDHYLFGDWGTGNFWALRYAKQKVANVQKLNWSRAGNPVGETKEPGIPSKITKGSFKPVNFCNDADGELLVLDWNGVIYEVTEKR